MKGLFEDIFRYFNRDRIKIFFVIIVLVLMIHSPIFMQSITGPDTLLNGMGYHDASEFEASIRKIWAILCSTYKR